MKKWKVEVYYGDDAIAKFEIEAESREEAEDEAHEVAMDDLWEKVEEIEDVNKEAEEGDDALKEGTD